MVIDGMEEESPDVVFVDLDRVAEGGLHGVNWLSLDCRECALNVDSVGNTNVEVGVERHGQGTHVECEDISGVATQNLLLQQLSCFLDSLRWWIDFLPIPTPLTLNFDNKALLLVCNGQSN